MLWKGDLSKCGMTDSTELDTFITCVNVLGPLFEVIREFENVTSVIITFLVLIASQLNICFFVVGGGGVGVALPALLCVA